jgi:hypothetical protein
VAAQETRGRCGCRREGGIQKGAIDSEKVGRKQSRENARRQGREARGARMAVRGAKAVERQGKNKQALWEIIGHREPGEERETSKSVRCRDHWGQ